MIFKKPADVRYTDMAIWIDENAYLDDCDNVQLYEYLFHLVNMLAHRGCYFDTNAEYEDFSLSVANKLFLRLRNPKQAILIEGSGKTKLPQIKSILNYIKRTIYPAKMDYERDRTTKTSQLKVDVLNNFISNSLAYNSSKIEDSLSKVEFNEYLDKIVYIIREYLYNIPYISDITTWHNIYMSCLLSFLNSITLSNASKEKLRTKSPYIYGNIDYINKLYNQENEDFSSKLLFTCVT